MKLILPVFGLLLFTTVPVAAQPFILPLQPQRAPEQPPPQPYPVPVTPPQAAQPASTDQPPPAAAAPGASAPLVPGQIPGQTR